MNVQAKVVIGSSSLYFADKSFDAVRDHIFADHLGDASWIAWAILAGVIALLLGCGYVAVHRCWLWFRSRSNPSCPVKEAP